jgi:peptide/nickel transport system permease protein
MRAYLLKRLLLMVPTLFGISLVIWIVVTAAPGEPGGGRADREGQKQSGSQNESRRIFRAQFNLDKPVFFNDYVTLTAQEVLDAVRSAENFTLPPDQRAKARERLDDWGNYAVPPLVGALDLAPNPEARFHVLRQLPINARRVLPTASRKRLTPEEVQRNREILTETRDIEDRLTLDLKGWPPERLRTLSSLATDPESRAALTELDAKTAAWKAWYAERASRWTWTATDRWKIRLTDTRFFRYWSNLVRGDLGTSHVHREPVLSLIFSRLPVSLTLSALSLVLAYLISVPLGIWSAVHHRTKLEQAVSTLLFMLYSLPAFFTASLLLRYLGIGQPWRLIPVEGFESTDTFSMTTWEHVKDVMWHVAAPLFCLTYVSLAALSRYAKSGILNVIRSDYVRTARAKGVEERWVIWKHTVRNGIIPIVTLLGTTLPAIVGGSIIIESVFRIPGIGFLLWDSILQRDFNVVIGESLIVAILTMIGILVSDILYAVVDPRIRFQ